MNQQMLLLKATAYLVVQKDVKRKYRALQVAVCCISVSVGVMSPIGSAGIGGSIKRVLPSLG